MGCINSTNKSFHSLKRDGFFNVSVVRVQSQQPIILAKRGLLEITPHELIFIAPEREPVTWALQHLRRYGITGNVFSFESGRRCPNGSGIYTFKCCDAGQFYAKFQRCINSMSAVGERSNISVHPFQIIESHQQPANNYLEPTSFPVAFDEPIVLPDYLTNDSNEFNPNLPDTMQSPSLNAEIIHIPSTPSYSNIVPNARCSVNIYMEQPIRISNEHNSISSHKIVDSTIASGYNSVAKTILKSSSLDIPPDDCAPVLKATNVAETQRHYENIDATVSKTKSTSPNGCKILPERFNPNVEILPTLNAHSQYKSFQLDFFMDQQQSNLTKTPPVNYIILDLDQPRSPSQSSPKNLFGSGQSFTTSGENVSRLKKDDFPPSYSGLSYGSSTMPKRSTFNEDSSKLSSKLKSSGSYTRIDFLKTFALMNSSTNYTDFDIENDQGESRITRHSKFLRKAYSISE